MGGSSASEGAGPSQTEPRSDDTHRSGCSRTTTCSPWLFQVKSTYPSTFSGGR
ncbi:hypothetical protein SALBM217S_03838 [Streptomyces griseoloalbus]